MVLNTKIEVKNRLKNLFTLTPKIQKKTINI